MRTFKFLAQGARGPFSGYLWTTEWSSSDGPLVLGRRGFHVCRPTELAFWLHDELWETEIAGAELVAEDCLVAERARLVRRVPLWHRSGAQRFVEACMVHAAERATNADFLADAKMAASHGYPAVAAYSAALATGDLRTERVWQSTFIAEQIIGDA